MGRSLLVIDDSKLARMAVSNMIGRLYPDWTVVQAASAEEALRALRERPVDIALVDINMPEMSGLELASRIRGGHPDLPMAMVSANAQDANIAEARRLDAAFLEKPLSEDMLAAFLSGAVVKLRRGGA